MLMRKAWENIQIVQTHVEFQALHGAYPKKCLLSAKLEALSALADLLVGLAEAILPDREENQH